jgi:hypothetical protein
MSAETSTPDAFAEIPSFSYLTPNPNGNSGGDTIKSAPIPMKGAIVGIGLVHAVPQVSVTKDLAPRPPYVIRASTSAVASVVTNKAVTNANRNKICNFMCDFLMLNFTIRMIKKEFACLV